MHIFQPEGLKECIPIKGYVFAFQLDCTLNVCFARAAMLLDWKSSTQKLEDSQSPSPTLDKQWQLLRKGVSPTGWAVCPAVWKSFRSLQGCGFYESSHAGVGFLIQLPMSHPWSCNNPCLCSVSKPHKLIGSPSWASVELFLYSIMWTGGWSCF